jgi:hypothetical protein
MRSATMRASVTPEWQPPPPSVLAEDEARRMWRMLIQREVLRLARRGDKVRPELLRWAKSGWSNNDVD